VLSGRWFLSQNSFQKLYKPSYFWENVVDKSWLLELSAEQKISKIKNVINTKYTPFSFQIFKGFLLEKHIILLDKVYQVIVTLVLPKKDLEFKCSFRALSFHNFLLKRGFC